MSKPEPTIGNIAMLVGRLVQQVRRLEPNNPVADKAMDYLRRCDLTPSLIREAMPKPRVKEAGE